MRNKVAANIVVPVLERLQQYVKNPVKYLQSSTVEDIIDILEVANEAYRNSSHVMMSDDVYDMGIEYVRKHAPKHTFLKKVGAKVVGEKTDLPYWMGSLDKIRDDDTGIEKWTSKYPGEVVVSDKLDGNSGLFVCKDRQCKMYTRGDGYQGQDITNVMLAGIDVPVSRARQTKGVAVRGELIISKENWNPALGANARNVVAGILHTKQPKEEIVKLVDFVAYELLHPSMKPSEGLAYMKELGFHVVDFRVLSGESLSSTVLSEQLLDRRTNSTHDIDGVVVMHNTKHKTVKGSNPKHAFAFKTLLTHTEAEVIVSSVEWNASKDGYLKPTVHFPAVSLNGVKIQKATGFNAAFIKNNGIGPGARVVIIRSGDVIPHIIRVTQSVEPQFPDVEWEWNSSQVDIIVKDANSQVVIKQLEHFAKIMSIPSVSKGTLKKLVESGLVHDIPSLLAVRLEDIQSLDGFAAVSAHKVYASLQAVKHTRACVEFMVASNVFGRGLGQKKIQAIIAAFPKVLNKVIPTIAEISKIPGIGPETAQAFVDALPAFFDILKQSGVECGVSEKTIPKQSPRQADFNGMTIVFTGFRNKEWEQIITTSGGKVTSNVSKNTNIIVAVDTYEQSSKLIKAKELGIKIISKDAFAAQFERS